MSKFYDSLTCGQSHHHKLTTRMTHKHFRNRKFVYTLHFTDTLLTIIHHEQMNKISTNTALFQLRV